MKDEFTPESVAQWNRWYTDGILAATTPENKKPSSLTHTVDRMTGQALCGKVKDTSFCGNSTIEDDKPTCPSCKKKDPRWNTAMKTEQFRRIVQEEARRLLKETTFQVGQTVQATETTQGLQKGKTYKVVDVHEKNTPWGDFVTYELQTPEGKSIGVGNGHLVLKATKEGLKEPPHPSRVTPTGGKFHVTGVQPKKEASSINPKDVPVYDTDGKVLGHVSRNATGVGAAKVAGSQTAHYSNNPGRKPGWIVGPPPRGGTTFKEANEDGLFSQIRPQSRVTIVNRFGQNSTGKAVMRGPDGYWVLNMGGAHGTPAVATPDNVVAVKGGAASGGSGPHFKGPVTEARSDFYLWGKDKKYHASGLGSLRENIQEHLDAYLDKEGIGLVWDDQGHAIAEVSVDVKLNKH